MLYRLSVLSAAISLAGNVRSAYAGLAYISFLKLFFYLLSSFSYLVSYNLPTRLRLYMRSAYFAHASLYYIRCLDDLLLHLVSSYIVSPPISIYFYI
jgi:hypothetical protein